MNLRHLFLFIPIILITLSFSCKSPSGPDVPKNPREYTWTVDTLYIPPDQMLMDAVWGSANDLYTVGHSSGTVGTMWHFDGNKWTNVKLGSFEGGVIPGPYDLAAIHGLGADNVYAVGQRSSGSTIYGVSFIIHYDGKQWTEQQVPSGNYLQAVWANSPNDVWACGINGTLLHYDGIQWKKDSVVITTPSGSLLYLSSIAQLPSGELFMLGAAYEPGTPQKAERWTYYFLRREGVAWKLLDTFVRDGGGRGGKWGGYRLVVLPTGTMYSVDSYGVFQWNRTQWVRRYNNIKNSTTQIFGTSDDNFFVTGTYGLLAHFNGTDWSQYSSLIRQNAIYTAGWADEQQVFVMGWVDGEKTIVLHGK